MTKKSEIHVFSFRMTDNERDENTVNDVTESDNDQELLVEASRDTSHATTNLETLMHLFKVCKRTIDIQCDSLKSTKIGLRWIKSHSERVLKSLA